MKAAASKPKMLSLSSLRTVNQPQWGWSGSGDGCEDRVGVFLVSFLMVRRIVSPLVVVMWCAGSVTPCFERGGLGWGGGAWGRRIGWLTIGGSTCQNSCRNSKRICRWGSEAGGWFWFLISDLSTLYKAGAKKTRQLGEIAVSPP